MLWRIYYSFQAFGKKSRQMNRSAKGLSIVTTNLDGFSLQMICQTYQTFYHHTFPLYGIMTLKIMLSNNIS